MWPFALTFREYSVNAGKFGLMLSVSCKKTNDLLNNFHNKLQHRHADHQRAKVLLHKNFIWRFTTILAHLGLYCNETKCTDTGQFEKCLADNVMPKNSYVNLFGNEFHDCKVNQDLRKDEIRVTQRMIPQSRHQTWGMPCQKQNLMQSYDYP